MTRRGSGVRIPHRPLFAGRSRIRLRITGAEGPPTTCAIAPLPSHTSSVPPRGTSTCFSRGGDALPGVLAATAPSGRDGVVTPVRVLPEPARGCGFGRSHRGLTRRKVAIPMATSAAVDHPDNGGSTTADGHERHPAARRAVLDRSALGWRPSAAACAGGEEDRHLAVERLLLDQQRVGTWLVDRLELEA
jgi:hypothetical protein